MASIEIGHCLLATPAEGPEPEIFRVVREGSRDRLWQIGKGNDMHANNTLPGDIGLNNGIIVGILMGVLATLRDVSEAAAANERAPRPPMNGTKARNARTRAPAKMVMWRDVDALTIARWTEQSRVREDVRGPVFPARSQRTRQYGMARATTSVRDLEYTFNSA